jgi:hypothetical protein
MPFAIAKHVRRRMDGIVAGADDAGIALRFAELKDPVKDKLRRFGFLAQLGEESFFPTIEVAVDNYLRLSPAQTEIVQ